MSDFDIVKVILERGVHGAVVYLADLLKEVADKVEAMEHPAPSPEPSPVPEELKAS